MPMNKEGEDKIKFDRSVQDYLSIGYIYLLLLGIMSDSVFYGFMGINIMNYSNVLDILLSPANYLAKGIIFPIAIILMPIAVYGLTLYNRATYRKKRESPEFRQKNDIEKLDHQYSADQQMKGLVILSAIMIFSAYIGFAIGNGAKIKEKIESGKFKLTHQLTYTDGDQEGIYMIGHNSQYVFFLLEGAKSISIAPISGNVKKIDKLSKEK